MAHDRTVDESFRGQKLEGVDFSGKGIRGTDFSGANLRSANFSGAELGVPPRVGTVMLLCAMVASIIAGIAIGGGGVSGVRDRIGADQWDEVAEGGTMAGVIVILVVLIVWKGFDTAFKVVVVTFCALVFVNVIANLIWDEVEYVRALRATAIVFFLVMAVATGIFGRVIGGVFGSWSTVIVAVLGGLASGRFEGGIAGIAVALSLVLISKRAVRGDGRDRTLRLVAHRLVGRWGTKFVDADLTGADFTRRRSQPRRPERRHGHRRDWDPELPSPLDVETDPVVAS